MAFANRISLGDRPQLIAPDLVHLAEDGAVSLRAGQCQSCGEYGFPAARICARCRSEAVAEVAVESDGRLYAFSIVHQAPQGWDLPYAIGYVDLPEGIRILAHLEPPFDRLIADAPVELGIAPVGTDANGDPLLSFVYRVKETGDA